MTIIKADLYIELKKDTTDEPLINIVRDRVVELFDKLISEQDITDPVELGKIVKLRANTMIELKDL